MRLIAINSAMVGLFKSPKKAYNLEPGALWRHSYATAILALIISKYLELKNRSTIYTAAFLHDIGKVILNQPLLVAVFNKQVTPQDSANSIDFEFSMLSTDHAKVGMALLQKWNLPSEITDPVGFHHSIDMAETERLASQIVDLSNVLVRTEDFRAIGKEQYIGRLLEYVTGQNSLQGIPDCRENLESILNEFHDVINDTEILIDKDREVGSNLDGKTV